VAAATVSVVNGSPVWSDIPPGRLAGSLGLAVGVGAAIVAVRLVRLVRSGRHAQVTLDRRLLERGWAPTWRRARLDLVAIAVGVLILGINLLAGGLRATPVEGPPLALSFYVLLAPVALWIGVSLLAVRGLLVALARWARPDRARPLSSWRGACLRWLGRRPARAAVALVIGTLAVAFGTEVVTFAATYSAARHADARAGFGADLRLTPAAETPADPPAAAGVAATTPIRFVPARIGSDRKTILTLDLSSYGKTATVGARMLTGAGVDALAQHPDGVLIAPEIAEGFAVGPGDPLPVTVFPDDGDHSRNFTYRVVGVFRSFPPTDPPAELVMATTGVPPFLLPSPETYLVRVAPGHAPAGVAAALRQGPVGHDFRVTTIADQELAGQRSLTTLNLAGLSTLESLAAGLIAAVGVAVLGAFVALERRREFAILRTLGADRRQVLTGAAQEGAISVFGSVILGVPIGLGIALVSVRVLGLFFVLPPPLLALAAGRLGLFLLLTVGTSAAALAVALVAINRVTAATTLRE
jgi:putative ABC transport system permease protein